MNLKKFKVGRWYHNKHWVYNTDCVKMEYIDVRYGHGEGGGVIGFKECVYRNEYCKHKTFDEWHFEAKNMVEVSYEELKKFLPKNHKDLRKNNLNNKL